MRPPPTVLLPKPRASAPRAHLGNGDPKRGSSPSGAVFAIFQTHGFSPRAILNVFSLKTELLCYRARKTRCPSHRGHRLPSRAETRKLDVLSRVHGAGHGVGGRHNIYLTDEGREVMGEFRAQDHTQRKRNPKRREQIPSNSRAVEPQRIVGPFLAASPPTFNLFLQKEQLELFWPRGVPRHIPLLLGPGSILGPEGQSQARGPFTRRRVFCPWPPQKGRISEAKPNLIEK